MYQSDAYFYGKLYNVGEYPAAIEIENSPEKVFGELYRIIDTENLFERLDEYEECNEDYPIPHDYVRKTITVYDMQHQPFQAWCYLYNLCAG